MTIDERYDAMLDEYSNPELEEFLREWCEDPSKEIKLRKVWWDGGSIFAKDKEIRSCYHTLYIQYSNGAFFILSNSMLYGRFLYLARFLKSLGKKVIQQIENSTLYREL